VRTRVPMTTLWERRIAHIDRRVGPLEWRGARRQLLKAAVKKRRGLPSRNIPADVVFDLVGLKVAARKGDPPNREMARKLEWRLLRERMLERKRAALAAARRRVRRSVEDTRINLWRRRQDWLRAAQVDDPAASPSDD
jgi:hypothetical protein